LELARVSTHQLRQLGDVRRDPSRLIAYECLLVHHRRLLRRDRHQFFMITIASLAMMM
jgi:hypothetical protein